MSDNLPAEMNNYANSAMVNMPLYEVDMLRGDLIKANSEVAALKDAQKMVVVRVEQEVLRNNTVYDNSVIGNYRMETDSEIFDHIRMVNLDKLEFELKSASGLRISNIINEYEEKKLSFIEDLEKKKYSEVAKIKKKYDRMEASLHDKYDGDKIEVLESHIRNLSSRLKKSTEVIEVAEVKIEELSNKVYLYEPSFSMAKELSEEYLEYDYSGVLEKYLRGFYKKIDKIVNKYLNPNKNEE